MAKNRNINSSSLEKIEIDFQDCCRGQLCVKRFNLSKRGLDTLKNNLNNEEMEMLSQVMSAQDVGCFMPVIIGLRSLVESLINKACNDKKIPISEIENGKIRKHALKEKFLKIEEYFNNTDNADLFLDIIETANDTIHELKNKLQRGDSEKYIRNFIKTLDEEYIFVDKYKQINFIRNWIKENVKAYKEHFLRTGFWLAAIYNNPSDVMQIAAVGHDIERQFPLKKGERQLSNDNWDNEEYLLWHGKRSATHIEKLLISNAADKKFIKEIKNLVIYHEIGGDQRKDAIKDADSISFLENNANIFIKKYSKDKSMKKIKYMFNRISSSKAKRFAKPFYEDAIKKINLIQS